MNKKYVKPILLTICGALFVIFSIILFASSAVKKDSSYETANGDYLYMFKYKFNPNYLIGMILGFMMLGYAIYVIYSIKKNKAYSKNISNLLLSISFLILCAYCGKQFFEKTIEDKIPFKDTQVFLYSFIILGIICAYFVIKYLFNKKEIEE